MKASLIRQKFIQFFADNRHQKVDSSSLVPQNDPTLLFANAGMNQFKDFFIGRAKAAQPRAVSVQKCVRAGGKHNDLENVGFTARHHTFFEMLGNFSFGDYFKEDAIQMAWTFLTQILHIDEKRLYVTVHHSDQDAFKIWNEKMGLNESKIFYKGDKDNFWEMGNVGPCGPCTEIFYDHGPEFSDGIDHGANLLDDELRYVEIWNLVFMQYEKYEDHGEIKQKKLPNPCVDTGAGLERIAALMQGKYWNYDSDLFSPIIKQLEELSQKSYQQAPWNSSMRVVADHIRAATMLITDGILPSNEGRGYVLRRIIRRGVRHLEELGLHDLTFHKLVDAVFEILGTEYAVNAQNAQLAKNVLMREEEKFRKTLSVGLKLIKKEMENLKQGDVLSGDIAFKLYDTYGFPLDLTEVILREKGFLFDQIQFDVLMNKQKELAKSSSAFKVQADNLNLFFDYKNKYGNTNFIGYENLVGQSVLLDIIHLNDDVSVALFKQTPFYAESGGQMGDIGHIVIDRKTNSKVGILDTKNLIEGIICHFIQNVDTDLLHKGNSYTLEVDAINRQKTKCNHSATHILQASLIKCLGTHIKQAGSSVAADKLRFDFTNNEALTPAQINRVELLVNETIMKSLPVKVTNCTKNDALKMGATALFGEKYGDEVRVISMGDYSMELCGGTHVQNTSEIGLFKIIIETSLSSGVRRIEAVTSNNALIYLNERSDQLKQIENTFSAKGTQLFQKINSTFDEIKIKQKEIEKLNDKIQNLEIGQIKFQKSPIKNLELYLAEANQIATSELKAFSDKFMTNFHCAFLIMSKIENKKVQMIIRRAENDQLKSINLNNLIKPILTKYQGKGGGRPDSVQINIDDNHVETFVREFKDVLVSTIN